METVTTRDMYWDRADAGRRLAALLEHHAGPSAIVLGLPRGGVPVAREVSLHLHAPLDVLLVRKLGVPWHPELAMGAVGEGRVQVLNDAVITETGVTADQVRDAERRARRVIEERAALYRCGRDAPDLHGKTAIIVDDGIATGATARAACTVARLRGARRVVLAVPVAPRGWESAFRGVADELVCPTCPEDFVAVGQHYRQFGQVSDSEVVGVLATTRASTCDDGVMVEVDGLRLPGRLTVPAGARGLVVFAHGSGSSRRSPRNVWVAARLNERGLGTLLFDLLDEDESEANLATFDIELLAERLGAAVRWAASRPQVAGLGVGLFGASTGAAAALVAAAADPVRVTAVVSRGGRPDLAWNSLTKVRQPVLLIVGGRDTEVLEINRRAADRLGGPHVLTVVAGAGHLFEEPQALEQVAEKTAAFFIDHLG